MDGANNIYTVFTVVSVLVAIIFGSLFGRSKGTIDSLEKSNAAYKELADARDLQHEAGLKRIQLLESKANILENQVTQAPAIIELAQQISAQHQEMIKGMGAMTKELGNIAKSISKKEAKKEQ